MVGVLAVPANPGCAGARGRQAPPLSTTPNLQPSTTYNFAVCAVNLWNSRRRSPSPRRLCSGFRLRPFLSGNRALGLLDHVELGVGRRLDPRLPAWARVSGGDGLHPAPESGSFTSTTISGLSSGVVDSFFLYAVSSQGAISPGVAVSAQTLSAPSAPTPIYVGDGQITFAWQPGGGASAGFALAFGASSAPTLTCPGGPAVPGAVTQFTQTGLTPAKKYLAAVCEYGPTGTVMQGPRSGVVTTTKGAPPRPTAVTVAGVTISGGSAAVTASWGSGGGSTQSFYVAAAPAGVTIGTAA